MEILSDSQSKTKKAGEVLAKELLKEPLKNKAFVLALEGDLGGGKTTFLQGFAKGLGIKDKILSPTFVILKRLKITKVKSQKSKIKDTNQKFENFYHLDCYRIQNPKEILNLDFKKIISDSHNVIAIEWAERIRKILPKDTLILKFEFINKKTRKIWLKKKNV
jgi:tRNA threonylcarbamoyladenosine biosynthesis protein TsaE